MDVYVARQPIFDRRMNVFGYELLYRRSMNNFYEGVDGNRATAELINNAFMVLQFKELTNGTRAFINFPQNLIEKEIPFLLPKEKVIIEILEEVEVSHSVIQACKKLKKNGYTLALDDFIFSKANLPLVELADIIKVEFSVMPIVRQKQLIRLYKNRVKFIAEKIETREQYQMAVEMGYDYFQGYFFSRPVIVTGKEIISLQANLMRIINESNKSEPNFKVLAEFFEKDLGLSYKILKLANSVYFGGKRQIQSIRHALVRLGMREIKRWTYIMFLRENQNPENRELIRNSLIRGKVMEALATEIGYRNRQFEFFITGIFSSIDALLGRDMAEVVEELHLSSDVKQALLGKSNILSEVLNRILLFEKADWDRVDIGFMKVTPSRFMHIYIDALKWSMELDY